MSDDRARLIDAEFGSAPDLERRFASLECHVLTMHDELRRLINRLWDDVRVLPLARSETPAPEGAVALARVLLEYAVEGVEPEDLREPLLAMAQKALKEA